ncbi:unnamed protein product [Closterium sp. NIES-54]
MRCQGQASSRSFPRLFFAGFLASQSPNGSFTDADDDDFVHYDARDRFPGSSGALNEMSLHAFVVPSFEEVKAQGENGEWEHPTWRFLAGGGCGTALAVDGELKPWVTEERGKKQASSEETGKEQRKHGSKQQKSEQQRETEKQEREQQEREQKSGAEQKKRSSDSERRVNEAEERFFGQEQEGQEGEGQEREGELTEAAGHRTRLCAVRWDRQPANECVTGGECSQDAGVFVSGEWNQGKRQSVRCAVVVTCHIARVLRVAQHQDDSCSGTLPLLPLHSSMVMQRTTPQQHHSTAPRHKLPLAADIPPLLTPAFLSSHRFLIGSPSPLSLWASNIASLFQVILQVAIVMLLTAIAAGLWHSLALALPAGSISNRGAATGCGAGGDADVEVGSADVELEGGDVYSWGGNQFGQLGTGDTAAKVFPTLIDSPNLDSRSLKAISCGARHSVAVTTDGALFVWGSNKFGQSGRSFELHCGADTPVDSVCDTLASLTAIPPQDQLLICRDVRLEPGRNLGAYQLPDADVDGSTHDTAGAVDAHSRSASHGHSRPVFLFNKMRLFPKSPPPAVEEIEEMIVPEVIITVGEPSGEPLHPLDRSGNPLLRAIPSYERQFRQDLLQAQAYLAASQSRFDTCRRLLQEQHTQAEAVRSGSASMEAMALHIVTSFADFQSTYKQQHCRHELLLRTFHRNLRALHSCRLLAPVRAATGWQSLVQLAKEPQLQQAFSECHVAHAQMATKVAELEQQFEDTRAGIDELIGAGGGGSVATAVSGPGTDAATGAAGAHAGAGAEGRRREAEVVREVEGMVEEGHRLLEEQEVILGVLGNDYNTVWQLPTTALSHAPCPPLCPSSFPLSHLLSNPSKDLNTVRQLLHDCTLSVTHSSSSSSPSFSPSASPSRHLPPPSPSSSPSSSSSTSSSSSPHLQPIEAVAALDPICTVHSTSLLPRISAIDSHLASLVQSARASKIAMTNLVHTRMQAVARWQSRVRGFRNRLHAFREAISRQDALFSLLASTRALRGAYADCLGEIARRKGFGMGYMGRAQQVAEEMARVREEEVERRERFWQRQGELGLVPRVVIEGMGLGQGNVPSVCTVSVAPFDERLVSVGEGDLPVWGEEGEGEGGEGGTGEGEEEGMVWEEDGGGMGGDGVGRGGGAGEGVLGRLEREGQGEGLGGGGKGRRRGSVGGESIIAHDYNEDGTAGTTFPSHHHHHQHRQQHHADVDDEDADVSHSNDDVAGGRSAEELAVDNMRLRAELIALRVLGAVGVGAAGGGSSGVGLSGGVSFAAGSAAGEGACGGGEEGGGEHVAEWQQLVQALQLRGQVVRHVQVALRDRQAQVQAYERRIRELEGMLGDMSRDISRDISRGNGDMGGELGTVVKQDRTSEEEGAPEVKREMRERGKPVGESESENEVERMSESEVERMSESEVERMSESEVERMSEEERRREVAGVQEEVQATLSELQSLQSKLTATESQLSAAQSNLSAGESNLATIQSKLTAAEARLAAAESQLAEARDESARLEALLSERSAELDARTVDINNITLEFSACKEELSLCIVERERNQGRLEVLQQELEQVSRQQRREAARVVDLEADVEQKDAELSRLAADLAAAEVAVGRLAELEEKAGRSVQLQQLVMKRWGAVETVGVEGAAAGTGGTRERKDDVTAGLDADAGLGWQGSDVERHAAAAAAAEELTATSPGQGCDVARQVAALEEALRRKAAMLAECQLNCAHLENRLHAARSAARTEAQSEERIEGRMLKSTEIAEWQRKCTDLETRLHEARSEARTLRCAADRRAAESDGLRAAAVRLRGLMERINRCLQANSLGAVVDGLCGLADSLGEATGGVGGGAGAAGAAAAAAAAAGSASDLSRSAVLATGNPSMGGPASGMSSSMSSSAGAAAAPSASAAAPAVPATEEWVVAAVRAVALGVGRVVERGRRAEGDAHRLARQLQRTSDALVDMSSKHELVKQVRVKQGEGGEEVAVGVGRMVERGRRAEGDAHRLARQLQRTSDALVDMSSKHELVKQIARERIAFTRFHTHDIAAFVPVGGRGGRHYRALCSPDAAAVPLFLSPHSLALFLQQQQLQHQGQQGQGQGGLGQGQGHVQKQQQVGQEGEEEHVPSHFPAHAPSHVASHVLYPVIVGRIVHIERKIASFESPPSTAPTAAAADGGADGGGEDASAIASASVGSAAAAADSAGGEVGGSGRSSRDSSSSTSTGTATCKACPYGLAPGAPYAVVTIAMLPAASATAATLSATTPAAARAAAASASPAVPVAASAASASAHAAAASATASSGTAAATAAARVAAVAAVAATIGTTSAATGARGIPVAAPDSGRVTPASPLVNTETASLSPIP